ncbi:hypothetical protein L1887_12363 [Cichorium endivia]|nr:hypothetical protein L1887_12363 [Cichorium endivia]
MAREEREIKKIEDGVVVPTTMFEETRLHRGNKKKSEYNKKMKLPSLLLIPPPTTTAADDDDVAETPHSDLLLVAGFSRQRFKSVSTFTYSSLSFLISGSIVATSFIVGHSSDKELTYSSTMLNACIISSISYSKQDYKLWSSNLIHPFLCFTQSTRCSLSGITGSMD